jgi:hypothetical protein
MISVSIKVPLEIEKDRQKVVQAAEALATTSPRAFEVFWSAPDNDLEIRLTAAERDAAFFYRDLSLHYPIVQNWDLSKQFEGTKINPRWLADLDPETVWFFDVSTVHGHAYASFDISRAGGLMTTIINSLQKAKYGWLQVEFYERNLTPFLNVLSDRMNARYQWIDAPTANGGSHPEKGREFHTNYKRLASHLNAKAAGKHVVTIVRGLTQPQVDLSGTRTINDVALPFGTLTASDVSVGEHLSTYYYRDPRILLDLCRRRAIEPDKPMREYVASYIHRWRQRQNLPFLVLAPSELALFVHLPDPTKLDGIKSTRGAKIPEPALPSKEGVVVSQ